MAHEPQPRKQGHPATRTAAAQAGPPRQPDLVPPLLTLLAVSRNLERIADHATNIAEDLIYLVEARIVRHGGNG